jgi:predicted nucleic acid-binding protein
MTLLDTDVGIDILRGHPPALAWLQGLASARLRTTGYRV